MKKRMRLAGAAIAAGTITALGSPVAEASPPPLEVTLPIAGNTHLAKPNVDVTLPEGGSLSGNLDLVRRVLKGDVTVPQLTAKMKVIGLGTTAKVNLIPTKQSITRINKKGVATTRLWFKLQLADVRLDLLPLFSIVNSKTCMTPEIATTLKSPGAIDLNQPIPLQGEFTVPKFQDCGLIKVPFFPSITTELISSLIAGSGNTMSINAGPIIRTN